MLKAKGFRKTGATWHRDGNRLVQVFNIQKSQWGDQFYLNVGIYLRDLGNEARPTEYRCHVRCRAERLLGDGEFADLRECLDFDRPLDRDQRYARLQQIVAERVLPWLDENRTLESLGTGLRDSTKGFAIVRGVPELLRFDMNRQRFVPDAGQ
jgi:hypothetical protein